MKDELGLDERCFPALVGHSSLSAILSIAQADEVMYGSCVI